MVENQKIMIYGSAPLTDQEKEAKMQRLFKYLHAKISAELLNPDYDDYDRTVEFELMEEIAKADIHPWLRKDLIDLLKQTNTAYDE